MSGYFDKRSEFFKSYFERALPLSEYVAKGSETHQSKWRIVQPELSAAQKTLCGSFKRRLNLLVLSGIWCGDCSRQGPVLEAIAAASSCVTVRFIESDEHQELRDELRLLGAKRVPVVVALSEDFFEVGRVGDRMLGAYRRKAERELGPACDLAAASVEAVQSDIADWLLEIERWELMLRLAPALRSRYGD